MFYINFEYVFIAILWFAIRMDGTGNCRQEYGNFKQSTFINIPIPKGVPARHFEDYILVLKFDIQYIF